MATANARTAPAIPSRLRFSSFPIARDSTAPAPAICTVSSPGHKPMARTTCSTRTTSHNGSQIHTDPVVSAATDENERRGGGVRNFQDSAEQDECACSVGSENKVRHAWDAERLASFQGSLTGLQGDEQQGHEGTARHISGQDTRAGMNAALTCSAAPNSPKRSRFSSPGPGALNMEPRRDVRPITSCTKA
jgi:hypothetical protein